ncbi:hypothetical protein LCGC14_2301780 [marine sediment metagenome]|uniref:Uncharacterized protein n=1 Tax=marine sediment metagenome TaxID=412755 RepID=A0A0F9CNT0_9ZZZZ
MEIKTIYAVVPRTVCDGDAQLTCRAVTRCETHEAAIESATHRIGLHPYDGMIIYQAVTLVQRTAPPIEVIALDENTYKEL